MKIDANDPRWTAYALGEIEDEQERAELESILEVSPEMRRLVEEIRNTGTLLSQELKAEPAADLTGVQRRRIAEKANPRAWFGLRPAWVMAATAAAVLLLTAVTIRQVKQMQRTPQGIQLAEVTRKPKVPAPIKNQAPQPVPELVSKSTLQTKADESQKPEIPSVAAQPITQKPAEQMTALAPQSVNQQASTQGGNSTSVANMVLKSSSTTGQVLQEKTVTSLPNLNNNMSHPINALGGVASNNANVQRDGITVGDLRFAQAGTVSPGRINPEMVNEFKEVLKPVSPPPCCGRPPLLPVQRMPGRFNTEAYDHISDNPFLGVVQNPLSTFSIDVDTASYSNMRRFLDGGKLPPKDSVRIEELVNYFDYAYKGPKDDKPFAINFELTEAPWAPEHRLLRIGLKGREIAEAKRPAGNLVFLLDVSGSMADWNKLPLIKESMRLLVDRLTEADRIAIVVYATEADMLLPYARGDQKEKIMQSIDCLHAGGSTNGASGIQLAYRTAQENFIPGGTNRIILATDGDFNVGITSRGDLARLIEEKAKSGIYLSALGFGMGNYKDATLEMLANKGHGNYAYIDTLTEAKKVLVEQIDSTLVTIAKDVKIQVEFNPRFVSSYRLIGYEDRVMAKEDFNDDAKDAGVIGAGHAVTALYELVPPGASAATPSVDPVEVSETVEALVIGGEQRAGHGENPQQGAGERQERSFGVHCEGVERKIHRGLAGF